MILYSAELPTMEIATHGSATREIPKEVSVLVSYILLIETFSFTGGSGKGMEVSKLSKRLFEEMCT